MGYDNITTKIGDGYQGWSEHAPFDKIIVTCSPEDIPQPLVDQLKEGGRLIVPLGERYQQSMCLFYKTDGKLTKQQLDATWFVPMTGQADTEEQSMRIWQAGGDQRTISRRYRANNSRAGTTCGRRPSKMMRATVITISYCRMASPGALRWRSRRWVLMAAMHARLRSPCAAVVNNCNRPQSQTYPAFHLLFLRATRIGGCSAWDRGGCFTFSEHQAEITPGLSYQMDDLARDSFVWSDKISLRASSTADVKNSPRSSLLSRVARYRCAATMRSWLSKCGTSVIESKYSG